MVVSTHGTLDFVEIQRTLRCEDTLMAGRNVTITVYQTIDSDSDDSDFTFVCDGEDLLLTLYDAELDGLIRKMEAAHKVADVFAFHDNEKALFKQLEVSIEIIQGQVFVGRDISGNGKTVWLGEKAARTSYEAARGLIENLEVWALGLGRDTREMLEESKKEPKLSFGFIEIDLKGTQLGG